MNGQINLFDEIDQEKRDRNARRTIREGYRKWLTTPELTPCGADARPDYVVYSNVIHRCETMPKEFHFWLNEVASIHGGQYWVLHTGPLEGEQMDVCPYCGADLCHGEGERFLERYIGHIYADASFRKYYGLDEVDAELERRCAV